MAADDVEFGHVVDLTLGEPSGTELVAAAAIGAMSLVVDYAGDFEDVGDLSLNGAVLTYTGIVYGDAETDPDTIALAAPLAVAAAIDDKVARMAGGELVTDWTLHVSLGDGHPVDIPIPFEQRAMWSSADVSTPIPVMVSADLERLVEVPGRVPTLDQSAIDTPFIDLYRTSNLTIADSAPGAFTTLTTWSTEARSGMSHAAGVITPDALGLYEFVFTVRWAGNSSGRRGIRVMSTTAGVDEEVTYITASPPDADPFTQQVVVIHQVAAGESFHTAVRQTSGAGLDMFASGTTLQVVRLQA